MFGEKGELTPAQVAEVTGRLPGVTDELESLVWSQAQGSSKREISSDDPKVVEVS